MIRSNQLESKIGHIFKDKKLLNTALCHSSYINEHHMSREECNERLEFLGDAVLELVVSDHLFEEFEKMPEGELSRTRAALVCEASLAECARSLSLGSFLFMGKGEDATGGRERDSVISDALEAVIGAIYLDGGYEAAKDFIYKILLDRSDAENVEKDPKSALQEMVQTDGACAVRYEIIEESGPEHDKVFKANVVINDEIFGTGEGRSKKTAEKNAAQAAINRLKEAR